MGPPKPSKSVKNHDFGRPATTPPKIIKNRLNFAHSEKYVKNSISNKTRGFYPQSTKIIVLPTDDDFPTKLYNFKQIR